MPDDPTPDEPNEPLSLKALMLAEARGDLPDGILDFLTTPLPAGPSLTSPNTVDNAIKCQGEFCVWLGGVMGKFEGLTPVSIPMFMAQLNSVQQGMLLSGLEAVEPTEEDTGPFEILEPTQDTVYYPGEMRISVAGGKDAEITGITGSISKNAARSLSSFDLAEHDGVWRQFVNIMENGEYMLTLTAEFPQDDPISNTVYFRIGDTEDDDETPEAPEGKDKEALKNAKLKVEKALKEYLDSIRSPGYDNDWIGLVKVKYEVFERVAKGVENGEYKDIIDGLSTEAHTIMDNIKNDLVENLDTATGSLGNIINKISAIVDSVL